MLGILIANGGNCLIIFVFMEKCEIAVAKVSFVVGYTRITSQYVEVTVTLYVVGFGGENEKAKG